MHNLDKFVIFVICAVFAFAVVHALVEDGSNVRAEKEFHAGSEDPAAALRRKELLLCGSATGIRIGVSCVTTTITLPMKKAAEHLKSVRTRAGAVSDLTIAIPPFKPTNRALNERETRGMRKILEMLEVEKRSRGLTITASPLSPWMEERELRELLEERPRPSFGPDFIPIIATPPFKAASPLSPWMEERELRELLEEWPRPSFGPDFIPIIATPPFKATKSVPQIYDKSYRLEELTSIVRRAVRRAVVQGGGQTESQSRNELDGLEELLERDN